MNIHPRTGAAAVGGALGVVIVSVLASINGIHLTPEANAAIPSFLALLGSWLSPDPDPAPPPPPAPIAPVAPVPPSPTLPQP